MKRIILLIAFAIFFLNSKAQITYFHYLDYQTEWREYSFGISTYILKSYFTSYFDGDTTLSNGKIYYKKYVAEIDSNFKTPVTISAGVLANIELIREDSSGKVWQYDFASSTDVLLRDWKQYHLAHIGDTIPKGVCVISNIDSVYFDSEYRKKLKSPSVNMFEIEGIGYDLWNTPFCEYIFDGMNEIVCFKNNRDSITLDNTFNCYNSFPKPQRHSVQSGISKIIERCTLNIFPNPTLNIVAIESSSNQIIKHAVVLDLLGRKVIDTEENLSKISLDLTSLNSSTYILKTQVGNEWIIRKIVKN